MKIFEIWFKELGKTHPDIYHDEIDCALAWETVLKLIRSWLKSGPSCGELERLGSMIDEELKKKK